jgi:hypothetical protein
MFLLLLLLLLLLWQQNACRHVPARHLPARRQAALSCGVQQLRARQLHMSGACLVLLAWWSSCRVALAASLRQR